MRRAVLRLALAGALSLCGTTAHADDPRIAITIAANQLPANHRVDGDLHLTAREAHRAVTQLPGVVLVDVRTHEETLFNGVATDMSRHIPYVTHDIDHSYDPDHQRYKLEPNPDFIRAVDALLSEKQLNRAATLIVYCSVGERSARAANLLLRSGFRSVYSVADGFESDPTSQIGPGWKASGLPWSYRLRRDQAYKSPSM